MNTENEILLDEVSEENTVSKIVPIIRKQNNKARLMSLAVIGGIVAVIIFLTGFGALSVLGEINGSGRKGDGIVTVEIPQGSSGATIAELLEKNDAIGNAVIFRAYCKLQNKGGNFNFGNFQIAKGSSYDKITKILAGQVAFVETVTVTIPEGTTIYDYTKNVNNQDVTIVGIATLLKNAGVCKTDDFFAALNEVDFSSDLLKSIDKENTYHPLEGYLFADTYQFYFCGCTECKAEGGKDKECTSKECAERAVKRMLDRTEEIITDEMIQNAENMGYTIHEILTLASIIQLESGIDTEEMANVSAVFHNRLKQPAHFAHLGSSPTIYYDKSMNGDGRYDTQNVAIGLPPGPVCSSGAAAINAAFMPTENFSYTYFVTDSDGKFYYNNSAAGHQSTIKDLRNKGKWIYEYF